jgi:hypothetical protein
MLTLSELAYLLPKDAQVGRLYPVTISHLAREMEKDRRLIARWINALVDNGIVLRHGHRLGIADPSEVILQVKGTAANMAKSDCASLLKGDTSSHANGTLRPTQTGHSIPSIIEEDRDASERAFASFGDDASLSAQGKEKEDKDSPSSSSHNWDKARTAALHGLRWRCPKTGEWFAATMFPFDRPQVSDGETTVKREVESRWSL